MTLVNRLFSAELGLPARARSMRTTRRPTLDPDETAVLFNDEGPGCILHWWIACDLRAKGDLHDPAHDLQLRLYYDGASEPTVDLPLAKYFGLLFDHDIYEMKGAAIKILPRNAFNCYLPMPFQACRMEIENRSKRSLPVWFMADWHRYDKNAPLTDMRLTIAYASACPAEQYGSFLMADISGEGFVAGMIKGVCVRDHSDAWYHTGGDLWLLDGEQDPHALRGIGSEDIFNMSYGIWDTQTDWVGAPHIRKNGEDTALGSGYEGVIYRFFGPDPVWFKHSAVIRFGSKANDLESLIYAYLRPASASKVLTVSSWQLAGPFQCSSYEDFAGAEWADDAVSEWPDSHIADFGQYLGEEGPVEFKIPLKSASEHGWCDFSRYLRGRKKTNMGTQPCEVSAYAAGKLIVAREGNYVLSIGFDDWLRLWINGKEIHCNRHDRGFFVDPVTVSLPAGESDIRVKLSNFDNTQWRLWAFCLTAEKAESG